MTARVLTLFPWPQLSADKFDAFWQLYPRKVAKKAAARAWAKLSAQERIAAIQAIPEHAAQWQAQSREDWQIPHASTWLNDERWTDEFGAKFASNRSLGECYWNNGGGRDPGRPRCCSPAFHTDESNGQVYCREHALRIGLVRRKA
jgi:hypothetical protein